MLVHPVTIGAAFGRRCIHPACTSLPQHTEGIYRSRSTGRKAPRRPRYSTPIMTGTLAEGSCRLPAADLENRATYSGANIPLEFGPCKAASLEGGGVGVIWGSELLTGKVRSRRGCTAMGVSRSPIPLIAPASHNASARPATPQASSSPTQKNEVELSEDTKERLRTLDYLD